MVVITLANLRRYSLENIGAKVALFHWHDIVSRADWANISDVKKEFPSVDYVGDSRFVFNIKGNKYRLIAMIHFDIRTVYIRFIGTHSEYDKIVARNV